MSSQWNKTEQILHLLVRQSLTAVKTQPKPMLAHDDDSALMLPLIVYY
jgi:hypothetical protein